MTSQAKKSKPQQLPSLDRPSSDRTLAWHMVTFVDFFEIDTRGRGKDYSRDSDLEFIRCYVAAGGTKSTASTAFLQKLMVLRSVGAWRFHHFKGVYFDLVALTATLRKCHRGWLIDNELKPLDTKALAARVFLSVTTKAVTRMEEALKVLLEAGLIEQKPLPDYARDDTDDSGEFALARKNAQTNARPSGNGKRKGKPNKKSTDKPERSNDRSDKGIKAKSKGEPEEQLDCEASRPPTTTPSLEPVNPKEPEAGQSRDDGISPGSARSKSSIRPDAIPLGQVVKIQDWDATKFGLEVFEALGLDKCFTPRSLSENSFTSYLIESNGFGVESGCTMFVS